MQHALVVSIELVVLGGNHNSINALRDTGIAILHCHLAFRIWSEIRHHLALLANLGKGAHQQMGQVERHRHQTLRLVGGIAEHHALVACTLILIVLTVNTTVDILALLVNGSQNTTRITVKLVFGLRIAYLLDGIAGNRLQVDINLTAHLAHDDHLSGSNKRLTGHAGMVVVSQKLVENGVAYLVSHLIGMTFTY